MKIVAVFIVLSFALLSCQKTTEATDEGYIDIGNNLKLYYQKIGNGKQKIIVPLAYWMYPDFRHLAEGADRTMVFYDVRGRFRSSPVSDSTLITHEEEVEDIERIRKHFNFERVSLIGESYTGRVVVLYGLKYPDRVERIVQIGSIPIAYRDDYPDSLTEKSTNVDSTAYASLEERYKAGEHTTNPRKFSEDYWRINSRVNLVADTTFLSRLGPQWGSHLQYEVEWFPNFMRHLGFHFQSYQNQKFTVNDLRKITAPVLTICGAKDRNVPFGASKEYATYLPEARLLRVPNAAHIPWIENPELVFNSIDTFLNGNWPVEAVDVRMKE